MKKIILLTLLVLVSAANMLLLNCCTSSTEPQESQKLVIENGFYSKVETTKSNKIQYTIEFTYYVKGEGCNWGGYSIQMDSQSYLLDLYKMQILNPNEKYMRNDTLKVASELRTNPVIKMQGYRIGSSDAYPELYAEFVLQPKSKGP